MQQSKSHSFYEVECEHRPRDKAEERNRKKAKKRWCGGDADGVLTQAYCYACGKQEVDQYLSHRSLANSRRLTQLLRCTCLCVCVCVCVNRQGNQKTTKVSNNAHRVPYCHECAFLAGFLPRSDNPSDRYMTLLSFTFSFTLFLFLFFKSESTTY